MKTNFKTLTLIFVATLALASCRKDDPIITGGVTPGEPQTVTTIEGFYLLNEGQWGHNKSSLDYYDYALGEYRSNLFGATNPEVELGLGDVGNDLAIYGSKLYAVVNGSNKVEVMDALTTRRIGFVEVTNCRSITFAAGKAYVSAYSAKEAGNATSPNGAVVEIDTASLQITRSIIVGRQPEGVAVVGTKLYVANSGGYGPYERTVSVIDLATFEKTKDIDVEINLKQLSVDSNGNLYVSSLGDYDQINSNLFMIDTQTDEVTKTFNTMCNFMTIAGDKAYIVINEFNYDTEEYIKDYRTLDLTTQTILDGSFVDQSVQAQIGYPYGICVDPNTGKVYIADARNFSTPGWLYCVDSDGALVFKQQTGDIPSHFALVYKTTVINEPSPERR